MISSRDVFDVRIGFSFIDYCLRNHSHGELWTYIVLRRHVWRGKVGPLAPLYKAGVLCCSVRQKKIAETAGVGYSTVKEYLARLEEQGWISTKRVEGVDELVYVLGERVKTTGGKYEGEVYYADAQIEAEVGANAPRTLEDVDPTLVLNSSTVAELNLPADLRPGAKVQNPDPESPESGLQKSRIQTSKVQNLATVSKEGEVEKPEVGKAVGSGSAASPGDGDPVGGTPSGSARTCTPEIPAWAKQKPPDPPRLARFGEESRGNGTVQSRPAARRDRTQVAKKFRGKPEAALLGHLAAKIKADRKFGGIDLGPPGGRELELARKLLAAHGEDLTREMIDCLVLDWYAVKEKWHWQDEVPSIVVLWMKKADIAAAVKSGEGVTAGLHRVSEWAVVKRGGEPAKGDIYA